MSTKVLIIDDEEGARESLKNIIQQYFDHLEIIGTSDSPDSGYEAICREKPDLVFLDIEMPGGSAFDLLERFNIVDFDIIFVTAYDHYAINAIKYSALDYILKPVDIDELGKAIERHFRHNRSIDQQLRLLMDNLSSDKMLTKVALPDNEGMLFVDISEIVRCESDGNYTNFIIEGGKRIMTSKTLGEFEEMFAGSVFCRIHRSHMINLNHVKKYIRGEGGFVIMDDDSEVEVSRRKKAEFINRMRKQ